MPMTSSSPTAQRPALLPSRPAARVAVSLLVALTAACGADEPAEVAGSSTGVTAPVATTPSTAVGPGDVVADCGDAAGPCAPGAPATVDPPAGPGVGDAPSIGATAEVVPSSVTVAEAGPWEAVGFVRNGPDPQPVVIEVSAVLFDDEGRRLGTASAPSLVAPGSPGEEVPFSVAADVPATEVADVRWSAAAEATAEERPALDVATFWVRPFGEARPIDLPGYAEASTGPFPFVLYGGVTAAGGAPVASPGAVAAWRGADGRVLAVASAPALVAGTDQPATVLAPGEALDVVLVVDDPVAGPTLADATPILWGVSRR